MTQEQEEKTAVLKLIFPECQGKTTQYTQACQIPGLLVTVWLRVVITLTQLQSAKLFIFVQTMVLAVLLRTVYCALMVPSSIKRFSSVIGGSILTVQKLTDFTVLMMLMLLKLLLPALLVVLEVV